MKNLSLSQLFTKDFFLIKLPKFKWGSLTPNSLSFFCMSKTFLILNYFYFFLDLKKLLCLVNTISYNKGICLSYFLDRYKNFFFKNEKKVKNFYIIFINKMFGFLSNFVFFLKNIRRYKSFTDYSSKRFPSVVFLSKKV